MEVDLTYQDLTPEADLNYYYVRVRQEDGQTPPGALLSGSTWYPSGVPTFHVSRLLIPPQPEVCNREPSIIRQRYTSVRSRKGTRHEAI